MILLILLPFVLALCPEHSQNRSRDARPLIVTNPCEITEPGFPNRFRSLHNLTPSLHASASGQLCPSRDLKPFLEFMRERVGGKWPAVIIDLRLEAHAFAGDEPIAWYCPRNWELLGRSGNEIKQVEWKRVNELRGKPIALYSLPKCKDDLGLDDCAISNPNPIKVLSENTVLYTEEEWCARMGLRYYRLAIPDHMRPPDGVIEEFIRIFKKESSLARRNRAKAPWFHLHCKGGKGRTSTFLAMLDILSNPELSFDQIVARQEHFNLKDTEKKGQSWKAEFAKDRLDFLRHFYRFAHLKVRSSWTEFRRDESDLKQFL